MLPGLRTYSVNPKARQPLIEFMTVALAKAGCKVISASSPDRAPFVIVFDTPTGERMGIVAYAFLATRTVTPNRPEDERSFQIKYGSKGDYYNNNSHELWQDRFGMFTTLLIGIDPERGYCVAADPVVHSPTKFFIRMEFKDEHAESILRHGWFAWERVKLRAPADALRIETLVGVTQDRFLDLVRFERAVRGLDPGNRLIVAEAPAQPAIVDQTFDLPPIDEPKVLAEAHPIAAQFGLSSDEILDLIGGSRRLKMAVRGWVAEKHLHSVLSTVPGVTQCDRLDEEGGPDLRVSFRHGPPLTIECKNVSRDKDRHGNPKIDFQRTRAAKGNPCSRYYEANSFDIVAACLHAVTGTWNFRYVLPTSLPIHTKCPGRISSNIRVDKDWSAEAEAMFLAAYASKGVSI